MRRLGGAVWAAGGLLGLIAGLAAVDGRVHEQIVRLAASGLPAAGIAGAGSRVRALALIVVEAVQDQSIEHAPLVLFSLAGIALVVFMSRS